MKADSLHANSPIHNWEAFLSDLRNYVLEHNSLKTS